MGLFGKTFNPVTDIPDLLGKRIFVTGGNTGLGKATILALAKHNPGHIYLSGRDAKKSEAAISEIKAAVPTVAISFVQCNLASLASVEKAAKQFLAESNRLDILICNAGIMALPAALTEDGYELQFGTNHLGHALLIKLLLPCLLTTAEIPGSDVRIVSLTSTGARITPPGGIVFADLRSKQGDSQKYPLRYRYVPSKYLCYGQSKLANVLYAAELARRYPSITSVSIHPGVVDTDLIGKLMQDNFLVRTANGFLRATVLKTVEQGAYNQLWAATAKKEEIVSGKFYEPVGCVGSYSADMKSQKLAGELWEWTQTQLERY